MGFVNDESSQHISIRKTGVLGQCSDQSEQSSTEDFFDPELFEQMLVLDIVSAWQAHPRGAENDGATVKSQSWKSGIKYHTPQILSCENFHQSGKFCCALDDTLFIQMFNQLPQSLNIVFLKILNCKNFCQENSLRRRE